MTEKVTNVFIHGFEPDMLLTDVYDKIVFSLCRLLNCTQQWMENKKMAALSNSHRRRSQLMTPGRLSQANKNGVNAMHLIQFQSITGTTRLELWEVTNCVIVPAHHDHERGGSTFLTMHFSGNFCQQNLIEIDWTLKTIQGKDFDWRWCLPMQRLNFLGL